MENCFTLLFGILVSCITYTVIAFQFIEERYSRIYTNKMYYAVIQAAICIAMMGINILNNPVLNLAGWIGAFGATAIKMYSDQGKNVIRRLSEIAILFLVFAVCETVGYLIFQFTFWKLGLDSMQPMLEECLHMTFSKLIIIIFYYGVIAKIWSHNSQKFSYTQWITYAIIIITVATMTAWIMALILKLQPVDFLTLNLQVPVQILFRLATSFCGVFGFSVMFNSPRKLAATAGCIGAVANTLRLEMVDLANMPPAAAAFIGALVAGILASMIKNVAGFPRISVTVPSIVIMVPGLYLYRAIYNLGIMSLHTSAEWFAAAFMIILALPLGLIFARILTDKTFRYCT